MTGARAEVTIDRPANEVWGQIGDFGDLSWIPNATSLERDGDLRMFQLGDTTVKHRLLQHDDGIRSYSYALITDGAPEPGEAARATQATLSVVPGGLSACTVTWSSKTENRKGSSERLSSFFQGILDRLKRQVEHA